MESVPQFALWPTCNSSMDPIVTLSRKITAERSDAETPFYIIDFDDLRYKIKLWNEVLPRVRPHYAVKCNANVAILSIFQQHGLGFDCATRNEINLVLSMGISPNRIVYAHTVKSPSYLQYAKNNGVARMTFDNSAELDKIKQFYSEAELILRLKVINTDRYKMSEKFGCLPEEAEKLLKKARALSLKVIGFSFHVGCQNQGSDVYRNALRLCKQAEQEAIQLGYSPKLIDIGGGFEGFRGQEVNFRKIAESIRKESDLLFPSDAGYQLISEPGTFFVGSALTLICRVVGKRNYKEINHIYVSDSVYMSFLPALYGDYYLRIQPMQSSTVYSEDSCGEGLVPTRIYGTTCDGVDIIVKQWNLPALEIGEWLLFYNQGAYTEAIETGFNMLERPTRFYRSSSPTDLEAAREALTNHMKREVESRSLGGKYI
ncbi:ornithine decarboxylase-like isoform X2 [Varroa destructor]|uniref:Ornithine decarboxylase n=1 Tax=Varroa destructor TaxID=109461 RepID=A0A7M7JFH5_VARDE|nr:ornithine decarboxylase-like isoform X2 [Varroa destructor]